MSAKPLGLESGWPRWFLLSVGIVAISIGGLVVARNRSLPLRAMATDTLRFDRSGDGATSDRAFPPGNDTTTTTGAEPRNRRLVAFDALGRRRNLALVEHARRRAFPPTLWDCVAFMYATDEDLPPDDARLRSIVDELGCQVVRTPGVMWGIFLQFLVPSFLTNYDYLAIVLDDLFVPVAGDGAVDTNKMIDDMRRHGLDVMSPAIVGDSHNSIGASRTNGLDGCLTEVILIETYLQIFTAAAWECYYGMLHYSGARGWGYAQCLPKMCPSLRLGQDFAMRAWHMKRNRNQLPAELRERLDGANLTDWDLDARIESQDYYKAPGWKVRKRYNCKNETIKEMLFNHMSEIECPSSGILRDRPSADGGP